MMLQVSYSHIKQMNLRDRCTFTAFQFGLTEWWFYWMSTAPQSALALFLLLPGRAWACGSHRKVRNPCCGVAVWGVKGMFLLKISWYYLPGFSLTACQVVPGDEAEAFGGDSCPWIPRFLMCSVIVHNCLPERERKSRTFIVQVEDGAEEKLFTEI